jgi:hypothetical protein
MLTRLMAMCGLVAIALFMSGAPAVNAQSQTVDWKIQVYPAAASNWPRPVPIVRSSQGRLVIYVRIGDTLLPRFAGPSVLATTDVPLDLNELPSRPSGERTWFSLPGRGVGRYIAVYARLVLDPTLPRIGQVNPINSICSSDLFPSRVMDDLLFRHVRALLADAGVLRAWCLNMGEAEIWLRDYFLGNRRLPWILF